MKNLYQNKFLLYPVFFLLVLFLLDKVFLLPQVRENFLQPGGMLYYYQRKEQIGEFKQFLLEKNKSDETLVVFGDSRSFAIGDMVAKYLGYKNLQVYNFAGPQALPAYYDYLAEQLFTGEQKPDYLLLGVSPDSFNRNSGTFSTPVMNFGLDDAYIQKNRKYIPEKDYDEYSKTRRYALSGMQFSFNEFFRRVKGSFSRKQSGSVGGIPPQYLPLLPKKDGVPYVPDNLKPIVQLASGAAVSNLSHYSLKNSPQATILRGGRGAQYAWLGYADDETLRNDTERLKNIYLKSFVISTEQIHFFRETLKKARLAGVKTVVFWPRVNPHLRELYKEDVQIRDIWRQVKTIAEEEQAVAFDLNSESQTACDVFYDASHMSITCSPMISGFLLEKLRIRKP